MATLAMSSTSTGSSPASARSWASAGSSPHSKYSSLRPSSAPQAQPSPQPPLWARGRSGVLTSVTAPAGAAGSGEVCGIGGVYGERPVRIQPYDDMAAPGGVVAVGLVLAPVAAAGLLAQPGGGDQDPGHAQEVGGLPGVDAGLGRLAVLGEGAAGVGVQPVQGRGGRRQGGLGAQDAACPASWSAGSRTVSPGPAAGARAARRTGRAGARARGGRSRRGPRRCRRRCARRRPGPPGGSSRRAGWRRGRRCRRPRRRHRGRGRWSGRGSRCGRRRRRSGRPGRPVWARSPGRSRGRGRRRGSSGSGAPTCRRRSAGRPGTCVRCPAPACGA